MSKPMSDEDFKAYREIMHTALDFLLDSLEDRSPPIHGVEIRHPENGASLSWLGFTSPCQVESVKKMTYDFNTGLGFKLREFRLDLHATPEGVRTGRPTEPDGSPIVIGKPGEEQ